MAIQKRVFHGKQITAMTRLVAALQRCLNAMGDIDGDPRRGPYEHFTLDERALMTLWQAKLTRMQQETFLHAGPDHALTTTINLVTYTGA